MAHGHYSISSKRVPPTAVTFTLSPQMCDCGGLIGARSDEVGDGEISAEAWLGWLRDLPNDTPHLARLSLLRAWSPGEVPLTPLHARGVRAADITESLLRAVGDEALLTIDYSAQRA